MSKSYWQSSFKVSVLEQIQRLPGNIILRQDIADMGDPRQVTRALSTLVKRGELVKIGYGIYAKTYYSARLKRPIIKGGFDAACQEAFARLGVRYEPGRAEKAYNAGESTQVPVRTIIHLKTRFRRRLKDGNQQLIVEDKINAR